MSQERLGDDILRGAEAIAEYLLGDRKHRRKIYHLASEVAKERRIPSFKMGEILCARKSSLDAWVTEMERRSRGEPPLQEAA